MCLAIPSRILEIDDMMATIDVYGARRDVNLMLLPEKAGVGDYVLVHAGFAIQKVEEDAARDSLRLIREMARMIEEEESGGD
jgi:hydrogenase expression/formation protein HypC